MARVLVDLPLAHLDRTFDYLVPATMAEQAVDGFVAGAKVASGDEQP